MSWLRSKPTPARCEDCLEGLLDCLLREETYDVVGHVTVVCERV